ncbi:FMN reductase (NADPH) [Planctomycetes bacterium Poly30]|uniref:FMN reductase (NADPH) n=1 Tax=Saltatorellus ferox TaxID=2528018 RepID=A0A518ES43_9BACT|nr:FMN reductase (NADPH) [Planctomycetes bacterium Poly30]
MSQPPTGPRPADADSVLALMSRHRSIRAFTERPVDDVDIERAVAAAQCAATSSWVQGYHLLQVERGARRDALSLLAGDQAQVREAPAFFVVCGDTRRHRRAAARAETSHVECTETFLLSVIDASLFAQNLVLAFESMGLGACYIGGLRNDLPGVDEVLGIPEGTYPLFGLTVGWPADDPGTRPRFAPGDVWTKDRFPTEEEIDATLDRFDEIAARYYVERGEAGRNWTGAIWRKFKTVLRPGLKRFYESKGASLS